VKPLLFRGTATAVLLALITSATAAPVTPPMAPPMKPPAPGPVADALSAMAQELGAATPPTMPVQQRMETLIKFRHSPATAAKLEKIYGSTPAWTLSRLPPTNAAAANGTALYRGALSALHFKDTDGSTVDWDPLAVEIGVRADGKAMNFVGHWPQLTSVSKDVRIAMRNMTVEGKQERSADGLWFGAAWVDIASVVFEPTRGGPRIALEGMRTDQRMSDRQKLVDLGYQFQIKRIAVGTDGVDNFKLSTRLTGIDRQTMLELQAYGEKQAAAGQPATAAEKRAALVPMLNAMARGAIRSGTALDIDELSASFHGQTLRANGRVSLENAVEADADNAPALLKKLVVKLHVTAPMALLREVTNVLAEVQVKARNKGAANPREVAQLAGSMNDIALGKMVSSGYVRVEGDTLISDIEFNGGNGGLRINGKAAALPQLPGVMPPGSGLAGGAGAGLMQARRIDDRCKLPDYPADVVTADSPLSLTMRLIVKADGSVRNVTLAVPSARPDYDQAVLAAAARCVYIPALRNGQPVDTPVAWKVTREAGSVRP
jgi:TonB family protein